MPNLTNNQEQEPLETKNQEPEPLGKKTVAGARAAWEKETLDFKQAKYLINTALCLDIMHSALVQMKFTRTFYCFSSYFPL